MFFLFFRPLWAYIVLGIWAHHGSTQGEPSGNRRSLTTPTPLSGDTMTPTYVIQLLSYTSFYILVIVLVCLKDKLNNMRGIEIGWASSSSPSRHDLDLQILPPFFLYFLSFLSFLFLLLYSIERESWEWWVSERGSWLTCCWEASFREFQDSIGIAHKAASSPKGHTCNNERVREREGERWYRGLSERGSVTGEPS